MTIRTRITKLEETMPVKADPEVAARQATVHRVTCLLIDAYSADGLDNPCLHDGLIELGWLDACDRGNRDAVASVREQFLKHLRSLAEERRGR